MFSIVLIASAAKQTTLYPVLQTVSQPVPCHVHHFLHQNPQAPHLAPQPGLAATSVAAAGRAGSSGGDACAACAFKGEAPGMLWKGDFSGVFDGVPLGDVFFGASGGVVGTSGGTAGMETRSVSASSFGSGIEVNFKGSGGKSLDA